LSIDWIFLAILFILFNSLFISTNFSGLSTFSIIDSLFNKEEKFIASEIKFLFFSNPNSEFNYRIF